MPIDTSILPVFLSAVAALLMVPGPDFFLITSQATSRGMKYGIACALGIGMAGIIQTALVALGLGKMMETWPAVATAVRLVGAVYLAVLGINLVKCWWKSGKATVAPQASTLPERSTKYIFLAGLANNLLNPKALLFFSVFIPQFVNPSLGSPPTQIAVLGSMLTLTALVYNLTVAFVFAQVKHLDSGRGSIARNGEGIVGVLFLVLAARLVVSRTA